MTASTAVATRPAATTSPPPPRRPKRRAGWWFPYAVVAPAVLLELAIHIIPMLTGIWISFIQLTRFYIRRWSEAPVVGLENYAIALDFDSTVGKQLLHSFLITCAFTVLVVGLSWGLGMAAAVALQKPFKSRGLWRTLFLIPYALPLYAGIITWNFMFQRDTGAVNHVLVDQLHLSADRPFGPAGNNAFVSLARVPIWKMWPFA